MRAKMVFIHLQAGQSGAFTGFLFWDTERWNIPLKKIPGTGRRAFFSMLPRFPQNQLPRQKKRFVARVRIRLIVVFLKQVWQTG